MNNKTRKQSGPSHLSVEQWIRLETRTRSLSGLLNLTACALLTAGAQPTDRDSLKMTSVMATAFACPHTDTCRTVLRSGSDFR